MKQKQSFKEIEIVIFSKILKSIKEGLTIRQALKKNNMSPSFFYKNASENQKDILKYSKVCNAQCFYLRNTKKIDFVLTYIDPETYE